MAAERLSDIAIQRELGTLPGWSRKGEVITKTFQFRNFLTGIDFVVAVARAAETADHHPDIDIRYTKIVCTLSTHSAGGITQKDLDLARQILTVVSRDTRSPNCLNSASCSLVSEPRTFCCSADRLDW